MKQGILTSIGTGPGIIVFFRNSQGLIDIVIKALSSYILNSQAEVRKIHAQIHAQIQLRIIRHGTVVERIKWTAKLRQKIVVLGIY